MLLQNPNLRKRERKEDGKFLCETIWMRRYLDYNSPLFLNSRIFFANSLHKLTPPYSRAPGLKHALPSLKSCKNVSMLT